MVTVRSTSAGKPVKSSNSNREQLLETASFGVKTIRLVEKYHISCVRVPDWQVKPAMNE